MLELKAPCEECSHATMQRCLSGYTAGYRWADTCQKYIAYQALLNRDKEVWAYIGEWFYEPLINLYLCDEDTKRKVRELWQSLKKG